MARKDSKREVEKTIIALRLIAAIVLFPFLWIGVSVNFLGIADRLSFLPGISDKGGVSNGLAMLAMTMLVIGLVVGALVVSSAGVSEISSNTSTPTMTATSVPTSSPNPTPTAAPQETITAVSTPHLSDLERFEKEYRERLEGTMTNETLTGIPVLAMEYRETENATKELWLVYWECDSGDETREQRYTAGVDFAKTVQDFDGQKPHRLRTYGVKNLETYPDSFTHIPTSSAERVNNGTIEPSSYTERWVERMREPTESDKEIAFQMAVNESGRPTAEEAFKEHYTVEESDGGCPVGAEPANFDEGN